MKPRPNSLIDVLAAGLLVMALLALPLFWARWFCKSSLGAIMPMSSRSARIGLRGLVPPEIEYDPNVLRDCYAQSHIIHPEAPQVLGLEDYLAGRSPQGSRSNVFHLAFHDDHYNWIYFDEDTGQMVCRDETKERMPDNTIQRKTIQLYAGPEGISETPDENVGRFTSPVVDVSEIGGGRLTLYDKKLRQFFTVKFGREIEFIKGPPLPEDNPHRPVDIGLLEKNRGILDLCWLPPDVLLSNENGEIVSRRSLGYVPIREMDSRYRQDEYVLVLDESGRIDLLDRKTLAFAGTAGHLPTLESLFPSKGRAKPRDLLAYRVLPVAFKGDLKYRGLFAAAVSREGTALALVAFDEKGKLVGADHSRSTTRRRGRGIPSSKAVFFDVPWAPVATIARYLLENLQPPVLSLVSYFAADSFEAASGHRALFLLPNSLIATKGRDQTGNIAERFIVALYLMLPSIILAIWLATRVSKDAVVVGLCRDARRRWIVGTIAFGLVGYITYRLIRPKITLVTCANCGKQRRPDMETCHRCGGKWDVPELTPPAWRVLDGAE